MNAMFVCVILGLAAFSYGQLLDMDPAAGFRAAMLINALQSQQQQQPPRVPEKASTVNSNVQQPPITNRRVGQEPNPVKAAVKAPPSAAVRAPARGSLNNMNAATALGVGMAIGE